MRIRSELKAQSAEPRARDKKKTREQFIPFVYERDSMGKIVSEKQKQKQQFNALQVFENLKKSSREYFFGKMYRKMVKKEENTRSTLKQRSLNYDLEVGKCFKSLEKFHKTKSGEKGVFYMELRSKIDQHVETLRSEIKGVQGQYTASKRMQSHKTLRKKQIKQNLFEQSERSKLMATFSNCVNQYRELVDAKKYDPWMKWYETKPLEVFPGKTIQAKLLAKNLYDI